MAAGRLAGIPRSFRCPGHRRQSRCPARPRLLPDLPVGQPQALGDYRKTPGPRRRRRPGDGLLQPHLQSPSLAARQRAGYRPPATHPGNPGGARPRYRPPWRNPAQPDAGQTHLRNGRYAHPGNHRLQPNLPLPACRGWGVGVYAAELSAAVTDVGWVERAIPIGSVNFARYDNTALTRNAARSIVLLTCSITKYLYLMLTLRYGLS